jgi:hypothetical protein
MIRNFIESNQFDLYQTSFLATPNADAGHRRTSKPMKSKYSAIQWNEHRFQNTVKHADDVIQAVHEKNMRDIRAQRAAHLAALEFATNWSILTFSNKHI